jgi:hypothetical protein
MPLGMGKQVETNFDIGWGSVQVVFYPSGVVIPPNKQSQTASPKTILERPALGSAISTSKP